MTHSLTSTDLENLLPQALQIAKQAAAIAMRYYTTTFNIQHKDDASPVTEADLAVDAYIREELKKLTPTIAIITEESEATQLSTLPTFWCVDPIDGTRSFIEKTGEFAICIGLIVEGQPKLGVIAAPVINEFYYGLADGKSFKLKNDTTTVIQCRTPEMHNLYGVISSYFKPTGDKMKYVEQFGLKDLHKTQSAIKHLWMAEGLADISFILHYSYDWDIAAAHAIIKGAGGDMLTSDFKKITYANKNFRQDAVIGLSQGFLDTIDKQKITAVG